jgi:lipopolysaccharide exporter
LKFSKNSYWLNAGFFSLLQNASNLLFGFGGFYLLVRLLNKPQMGAYTLFVTVTSIVEVARVGFIKYGFIKLRAEAPDDQRNQLFGSALALNLAFAVVVSMAALLGAKPLATVWNAPDLEHMFLVYAITSVLLVPFFQFEYLRHATLDFKNVFFGYFIRNGILFFVIVLSYLDVFAVDIFKLALFNLSGALVASSFALYSDRDVYINGLTFSKTWALKLAHYGKFVVGTSLGAMLYSAVDQFMLGSMLSTASVAIYNVAGRITNLINIPSMSISAIVFPKSAKLIATEGKDAVRDLYERSVAAILCIAIPAVVFVLLFSEFIIGLIAPGYQDSVPILQITIFMSLVLPFSYQFGVTLDSIGFPNINFYVTASFFLINLSLNYFWIRNFGVIGAAYGTLSTTIAGFVVMQVILNRMIKTSIVRILGNVVALYQQLFNQVKSLIVKS